MKINAVNGAEACVETSRRKCCENVQRRLVRLSLREVLENSSCFEWWSKLCSRYPVLQYAICTMAFSYRHLHIRYCTEKVGMRYDVG